MSSTPHGQIKAGAPVQELVARARRLKELAQQFLQEHERASTVAVDPVRTPRTSTTTVMCRVDLDPGSPRATDLVTAVRRADRVQRSLQEQKQLARRVAAELSGPLADAAAATSRMKLLFQGKARRETAMNAVEQLQRHLSSAESSDVPGQLETARGWLKTAPADAAKVWADVERRPDWYYGQLAVALGADTSQTTLLPTRVVQQAASLARLAEPLSRATVHARDAVVPAFHALRAAMVRRDLGKIPTARLKDATSGGLRLTAIEAAGFRTVLSVLDSSVARLQAIEGVGAKTAMQAYAAAQQVAAAVDDDLKFRIDLDPKDPLGTRLVVALHRWARLHEALAGLDDDLQRAAAELSGLRDAALPARGWVAFFSGGRTGATVGASAVQDWVSWADGRDAWTRLRKAESAAGERAPRPEEAWADFSRRPADYYALLGLLVALKTDDAATEGYLPEEVVARVHAQPLDATFANVSLRGYQSFGARFALAQERVIIGDEMGLGKTIQAIAALAHLKATGNRHFLVVCPASVVINWIREIRARSRLVPYQLHGFERAANERRWLRLGDVAVTTFDSLRHIELPADVDLAMLVVDEAHYAKNPRAQRSQLVADMATRAERVLFLTGTPMENRVEEFVNLVECLQPDVVPAVDGRRAVAGPDAFRRAVAPVYLRRNQEDVLAELPDLVQVDEWEEFGRADFDAYRRAVAEGNFMAMRRAAFAGGDAGSSPKIQRLLDLADEAGDNGHKVIVFSYFRDVLSTVHRALGARAFGPLTGDLPPAKRQALIDAFSRADGHGVLVSQIQAGGVGLNMQAASVVILCEPQVKPTMEAQAIARAHRMGQLRTVQVHRLLTQDSVDQRMLEILDTKARLFDEYARRSDIAESSPEAVDISEVALAQQVVAMEQERLAMATLQQLQQNGLGG